jgi:hypothetical protein
LTERKLDKVALNSKAVTTKVTLRTENLKEKANITSLILGNFTKVISKKTIWMEKVLWFGLMALDTTEISNQVKLKAKAKKNLQTEIDTLESGKTTFKLEVESFIAIKIKPSARDNGKMARDIVGQTQLNKRK